MDRRHVWLIVAVLAASSACSIDRSGLRRSDAGGVDPRGDAGERDASMADVPASDGGPDAGLPDAGPDTGLPDTGPPDTGPPPECSDGAIVACGASDVGECEFGIRTCVGGFWDACAGEIGPTGETCNGRDDDCDGTDDEGSCPTGQHCGQLDPGGDLECGSVPPGDPHCDTNPCGAGETCTHAIFPAATCPGRCSDCAHCHFCY